jgi:hypothetical protein
VDNDGSEPDKAGRFKVVWTNSPREASSAVLWYTESQGMVAQNGANKRLGRWGMHGTIEERPLHMEDKES